MTRFTHAGRAVRALGLLLTLFVTVLAAWPGGHAAGSSAVAVGELLAYAAPRPGAQLVSPGTTIALRLRGEFGRITPDTLTFTVVGAQSGAHDGTIVTAADGVTHIFQPRAPFAHGEDVTVTVSAGRGRAAVSTTLAFTVAPAPPPRPVAPLSTALPPASPLAAAAVSDIPRPHYRTAPGDLPGFEVPTLVPDEVGDGYIFIAYFNYFRFLESDAFLLILDNNGEPVYYNRLDPIKAALDFKKQPNGRLTWFNPDPIVQAYVEMDETYAVGHEYRAGNGYPTDLHDLQVLPNGNALLMIYDYEYFDMSALVPGGDPQAVTVGCIVQEVDPAGNVVAEWRSWDEISPLDSNQSLLPQDNNGDGVDDPIDYIHCNSIEQDLDGNWLLSSRHLDEVTKIDRDSAEIIWRFGGKANQFTINNADLFNYQHDARRMADGHLTVYDNGNVHSPPFSRAVEYELDEAAMTATLVWSFRRTPDVRGLAMGNHQRLPNGNSLIGWGTSYAPVLTEVNPAGEIVFELNAAVLNGTYRAFRFPWTGRPTWPPALAAESRNGAINLYFSWNGATEVGSYRVYAGQTPAPTTLVATVPRDGFETTYAFAPTAAGVWHFRVQALDKNGVPLSDSNEASAIADGEPNYLPAVNGP